MAHLGNAMIQGRLVRHHPDFTTCEPEVSWCKWFRDFKISHGKIDCDCYWVELTTRHYQMGVHVDRPYGSHTHLRRWAQCQVEFPNEPLKQLVVPEATDGV